MLSKITFSLLTIVVASCFASNVGADSTDVTTTNGGIRGWKERALQTVAVGQVDQLILYDAGTDQPILTLTDGMVVNTATLNANSFNIEATTVNGAVGSVKFGYNGNSKIRVEASAPYAMCGNSGTDFAVCTYLVVGQHTVTATSYSGTKADGTVGSAKTITFQIVNGASPPIPAPVMSPIPAPTTVVVTKSPMTAPISAPISTSPTTSDSCVIPKAVGSWETFTPNYPLNSPEAQSDLIGGDMVSTGGFNGAFNAVTKRTYARTINVANSSWRRMDDMSAAIGITHAATAIIGMKMYMCGGYEGPPPGPHVDYCFVYDHSKAPGKGQWSDFTPLPNGGSAGGGMIYDEASNALFYSGGAQRPYLGSNVAIDQDNTWKFSFDDPSSGWVASTPIPYKGNHQSHLTVNFQGGQRHFFAGGQMAENEAGGNVADLVEFVPSSETWIRRKSMPYPRGHASTSTRAYGCGFLIAGGAINGKSLTRTSDIHYYHIPSNTWTLIASLPVKKATPKVFMDEENDYLYFVDNTNTSRLKLSKS